MPLDKEYIIEAWLRGSSALMNRRLVDGLPFNEIYICNLLLRGKRKGIELTATWLCQETGMLKSQMNQTLNSLEKKGLLTRERSREDRRKVILNICEDNLDEYEKNHEGILQFVDLLVQHVGEKKLLSFAREMNEIAGVISHFEKTEDGWKYKK